MNIVKISSRKNKRGVVKIVLGILLVLGLVTLTIWAVKDNIKFDGNKSILRTVCADDQVARFGVEVSKNDITAMNQIYDEFKGNTDYTGDATCNYMALRYFISTGDVDSAKSHLQNLKNTIEAGGVVSDKFIPPAIQVKDLENIVSVLEEQRNNPLSTVPSGDVLDQVDRQSTQ